MFRFVLCCYVFSGSFSHSVALCRLQDYVGRYNAQPLRLHKSSIRANQRNQKTRSFGYIGLSPFRVQSHL